MASFRDPAKLCFIAYGFMQDLSPQSSLSWKTCQCRFQNVGLHSDWGPVLDVHHKYHVNVTVGVAIVSDRFYRAIRLTVDGVVTVSVTEGS